MAKYAVLLGEGPNGQQYYGRHDPYTGITFGQFGKVPEGHTVIPVDKDYKPIYSKEMQQQLDAMDKGTMLKADEFPPINTPLTKESNVKQAEQKGITLGQQLQEVYDSARAKIGW